MTEDATAATNLREDGPEITPLKAILADMEAYEREYRKWTDRAKGIIERYRDVRSEPVNQAAVARKFNILWSNTETLKPTLYARLPQAAVERRFKDADPVGKLASEIAERMGNYILDTSGFDGLMKSAVQDLLLPGRGAAWIGYDSDGKDVETGNQLKDEAGESVTNDDGTPKMETQYQKTREAVVPKYTDWKDFFHSPVRTWDEVKVVGRWVYLNKQELVDRFGTEKAEQIPLDRKRKDDKDRTDFVTPQAKIAEVYYKPTRKVYWVHPTLKNEPLDEADPPVAFENFWPCAKPLFATLTNDTLIPIPYFIFYQDQANELDIVTNRIARLTDALKASGVYDKSEPQLQRILSPSGSPDNILIPVDTWAAFKEKGGLAGAVELLPVDQIMKTLQGLFEARAQIQQIIYEVTGIADIIRGSSNPNETATAQSIKGQFASLRIKDMQAEVARFARDNARLIIECGVRMFEPETIAEMVMAESFCPLSPQEQQLRQLAQTPQGQAMLQGKKPPPPQSFMQAMRLLRDDQLRSFRIDIETDSTVAMNEQEDKQHATEFITAIGGFLKEAVPLTQAVPATAPMIGEMMLYAARRFKAGRSLEGSIEKTMQALAQPQPPKPDPAMMKAEADIKAKQADTQMKAAQGQQELQVKGAEHQQDLKFKAIEHQQTLQADAQEHQQNLQQKIVEGELKRRQAEAMPKRAA